VINISERERIIKLLKIWVDYLEKPEFIENNDAAIEYHKITLINKIKGD